MKTKNIIDTLKKGVSAVLIAHIFMACNASTDSSSSSAEADSSSVSGFPTQLAVTSPLAVEESSSSSSQSLTTARFATSSSFVPAYTWATGRIDQILTATTTTRCTFDPSMFLEESTDAECYGPAVAYESHPDASGGSLADGELPTGDVGMWIEEDPVSGNACAAEQLDSQLQGVQGQSTASLMGLASMFCVAGTLPDATTPSLDLTTDMNALGVTDTTFNSATIDYDSSTGTFSYELDFNYAPTSGSYDIIVDMEHTPGSSTGVYSGRLSYLVNDSFTGGNCATSDVTVNGSLEYTRSSNTEMDIEVRSAQFCDHDSNGLDSNGVVDPSLKLTSSNPQGWGNNFSIFKASYDPTSLDGNYAYSWQAGPQDDNTRSFNINVDSYTAVAFYGFGDDIETTDGSIDGFICNWAGPGSDHTIVEFVQYQELSLDTTTGVVTSDLANITYAPTVSCEYDGTGSFLFDTNADGDLSDEDATLDITISSGTMDLVDGQDIDLDGTATVEEVISDSDFVLP